MRTATIWRWNTTSSLLVLCLLPGMFTGCATYMPHNRVIYPLGAKATQGYLDLFEFYATENSIGTYFSSLPLQITHVGSNALLSISYDAPLTRIGLPVGQCVVFVNPYLNPDLYIKTNVEIGRIKSYCIYTFKGTEKMESYNQQSVKCRIREVCTLPDPAVNPSLCASELLTLLRSGTEIKQYYACHLLRDYGNSEAIPALEQLKAQDDRFRRIADETISSIRRRSVKN